MENYSGIMVYVDEMKENARNNFVEMIVSGATKMLEEFGDHIPMAVVLKNTQAITMLCKFTNGYERNLFKQSIREAITSSESDGYAFVCESYYIFTDKLPPEGYGGLSLSGDKDTEITENRDLSVDEFEKMYETKKEALALFFQTREMNGYILLDKKDKSIVKKVFSKSDKKIAEGEFCFDNDLFFEYKN